MPVPAELRSREAEILLQLKKVFVRGWAVKSPPRRSRLTCGSEKVRFFLPTGEASKLTIAVAPPRVTVIDDSEPDE